MAQAYVMHQCVWSYVAQNYAARAADGFGHWIPQLVKVAPMPV
jgi:hypothetical protein